MSFPFLYSLFVLYFLFSCCVLSFSFLSLRACSLSALALNFPPQAQFSITWTINASWMTCVMLWWAMTELPKQTRTERNFPIAPWRRRERRVGHERRMTSQRDAAAGDPKYFGRPTGPARPPTPSLLTGRRSALRYFYTFLLRTLPRAILVCLIDTSFTVNTAGTNNTKIQHCSDISPRLDRSCAITVQPNFFQIYFYVIFSFRSSKSLSRSLLCWYFARNLRVFLAHLISNTHVHAI